MTKTQRVIDLINEIFSDKSLPLEQTRELMQEIESAASMNICALDDDIAQQDRDS